MLSHVINEEGICLSYTAVKSFIYIIKLQKYEN